MSSLLNEPPGLEQRLLLRIDDMRSAILNPLLPTFNVELDMVNNRVEALRFDIDYLDEVPELLENIVSAVHEHSELLSRLFRT